MTTKPRRSAPSYAIFVIAATAVVAGSARAAGDARAQTPDSTAPIGRQLMPGIEGQQRILQHVRSTPASAIERGLPGLTLDDYLFASLGPGLDVHLPQFAAWSLMPCDDPHRAVPGIGDDLCVEARIQISADRQAHLTIVGATILAANGGAAARWVLVPPQIRDMHIDRVDGLRELDSLDVASLAQLADVAHRPFDQWPTVDLVPAIRWTPATPVVGDSVRFTFQVRNAGARAIDRAWVSTLIGGCCIDGGRDLRKEWFPHLAAGQSAEFEVTVRMTAPQLMAVIHVTPARGLKVVHESNDANHEFVAVVGDPGRPPR